MLPFLSFKRRFKTKSNLIASFSKRYIKVNLYKTKRIYRNRETNYFIIEFIYPVEKLLFIMMQRVYKVKKIFIYNKNKCDEDLYCDILKNIMIIIDEMYETTFKDKPYVFFQEYYYFIERAMNRYNRHYIRFIFYLLKKSFRNINYPNIILLPDINAYHRKYYNYQNDTITISFNASIQQDLFYENNEIFYLQIVIFLRSDPFNFHLLNDCTKEYRFCYHEKFTRIKPDTIRLIDVFSVLIDKVKKAYIENFQYKIIKHNDLDVMCRVDYFLSSNKNIDCFIDTLKTFLTEENVKSLVESDTFIYREGVIC